MNTPADIPKQIDDLLALYFDNQATPEVCAAIERWLKQDPAHPRVFAEYGYIERLIYSAQKSEDASAIFALLQEMEDNADAQLVHLNAKPFKRFTQSQRTDAATLTAATPSAR